MEKYNDLIHRIDNKNIKMIQICVMKLHIGKIIQQHVKDAKITTSGFAEMMHMERANAYNIFKREYIDTGLLYKICKLLNKDLFKLYSEELKKEDNTIKEPSTEFFAQKTHKVMIEVTLSEKEYQDLIKKRL
ncbi:MAG: hypothetical protein ACWA6U_07840 [Breznakibacter sp.]